MTQEAKAKRYDEAIKVAENIHRFSSDPAEIKRMEQIFPELAESEDERIRKALIKFHKSTIDIDGIKGGDILAWLEKQGKKGTNGNEREIPILAWSEEDETALGDALWCCKLAASIAKDENDMGNVWYAENWLKSIKSRVQPIIEWSKRDELMLEESIGFIKSSPYPYAGDTLRGEISKTEAENWIKSLKNRIQPQTKQEWSEEDEKMLNDIIMCGEHHCYLDAGNIAWLKHIKDKYTWKPSDEQVKALNYVINLMASSESPKENDYYYNVFKGLREQLMKLRGE